MINVGVVGYGYAGKCFHCYLSRLADGLNLHAVSSRDPIRREAAQKDYSVKTYASLDEMLDDGKVDLIILATPHNTHAELAIKAMNAKKHLITDKVMCMNAKEADAMIYASKQNNVLLSVFHNRRWDWDYLTVKKVIAEGLIGEPFLFESAIFGYGPPRGWRGKKAESGGILYDWGAHLIDQAVQLLDAKIRSVYCQIVDKSHWKNIDIGNYVKLLITCNDGTLFQVEVSNLARADRPRWYILGTLGSMVKYGRDPQEGPMVQGNIDAASEPPEHRSRIRTEVNGSASELVIDSVKGSWKSYYQNISDSLNKGAELAVKPESVRKDMVLLDAAMRSVESGEAALVST